MISVKRLMTVIVLLNMTAPVFSSYKTPDRSSALGEIINTQPHLITAIRIPSDTEEQSKENISGDAEKFYMVLNYLTAYKNTPRHHLIRDILRTNDTTQAIADEALIAFNSIGGWSAQEINYILIDAINYNCLPLIQEIGKEYLDYITLIKNSTTCGKKIEWLAHLTYKNQNNETCESTIELTIEQYETLIFNRFRYQEVPSHKTVAHPLTGAMEIYSFNTK